MGFQRLRFGSPRAYSGIHTSSYVKGSSGPNRRILDDGLIVGETFWMLFGGPRLQTEMIARMCECQYKWQLNDNRVAEKPGTLTTPTSAEKVPQVNCRGVWIDTLNSNQGVPVVTATVPVILRKRRLGEKPRQDPTSRSDCRIRKFYWVQSNARFVGGDLEVGSKS
ncbi:hypothetical protein NOR_03299 [Metarhizium rileyi]|uniref:Uncharacterized protein n=1 Tax=Metarhizium rileyi (strain RCEF 4871) TaxID=1649241 RepID=A0A162LVM8_METRR|nr:hypothetical protein NOR_03299 [Metarhizium rileyi RCEF 4871]